jgi:hypothetical protein
MNVNDNMITKNKNKKVVTEKKIYGKDDLSKL